MGNLLVAVAGSSGLIGSALVSALRGADHRVLRIVRRAPANDGELRWDPDAGDIDVNALAGVDAVVNMCGIGISDRRWSGAFKQNLRDSRITPTEVLSTAVAEAGVPVLINASGVGFYGDTGARTVDESAPAGDGFLARLTRDWEAATAPARAAGARVVLARTGLVLARSGGLLGRLRPLFSLGLGGRLGSGRQYMSWISLDDEIRALRFAMAEPALAGPVNLTGPAPVTNAEFTAALGRALNRPAPLLLPGFAARAAFGELADEGLLASQRAIPAALEQAGFQFRHNTIGEALAYATARPTPL
ncbi:TIGR01777 family oxidoreductase [Mycolicibacter kumamotonensis]|uniref:TIGR01777 family protein n=1 Tax=Mycolicibacter kumamotonensis TaxID=354243 RepID=A0A1X0E316_9MYCO|nr:TIGR01777 family oxidoreductase [Mycolicibacter kumamotonensis]NDJ89983.1 TIGR01777 family protein [Mycolicibacter kumamotonensis]ORA79017.1 TIGR01777 family protein [Mycolicibacter kumamotonensis]